MFRLYSMYQGRFSLDVIDDSGLQGHSTVPARITPHPAPEPSGFAAYGAFGASGCRSDGALNGSRGG